MPTTRKQRTREAKMDMTPMIDVTFLLLIFFLCLEFKSLEGKLGSNLPKDAGRSQLPSEPRERLDLRIAVTNAGTRRPDGLQGHRYELDGHTVQYALGPRHVESLAELEAELRRAAAITVPDPVTGTLQKRPLTIHTGSGVCYQDVTEVLDLAHAAEFREIDFALGSRRTR
ncbi:MAG: biopolymer transporter ExbD [Planctomycetes bacterium]|nr:biopolymer transporter ExbD [Planctomycetota bacterium]MCB9918134.1 biopolymer transporter ExbD [Planctomycetota bacterium]